MIEFSGCSVQVPDIDRFQHMRCDEVFITPQFLDGRRKLVDWADTTHWCMAQHVGMIADDRHLGTLTI